MKEKKFISLVVYLHNVEEYIKYFMKSIIPVCESNFEQFEIVCVDDGCTDGTVDKLKEYLEENQTSAMVNVIHMSFFQGIESAMNAGRDIAIGDFVYEFDDVFVDYEPELLLKVYEKMLEGSDIVAASSRGKLRFTSKIFYSLYNATSRSKGKIGPETFRIVSRRAINRIKSMGQYIPYRKAVYSNCGLKMSTLHYDSRDVKARVKNKTVASERTSLALDSFIYFTNVLERISMVICGFFLILTVAMGIYIISDFFNAYKPVEGWLSTMGFLALGFFGVFALLTIILKYLSVLLNLIFKQQRYLVADIEKVVKR
ncbi:MAG: glycosyltransferase [Lachnospiraceae bacterium]|nr:glycosyltransferase [Lachnospiraceae bacterium]MDD7628453.1 glycosyltransferase [Lachnospiraceae bacterium]MDY4119979.1 glycosyltransferase [Lachnospiraceae bacterium]